MFATNSMMIVCLMFLGIASISCSPYEKPRRKCPKLTPMANYSMDKVLGMSYMRLAYYPTGLQLNISSCIKNNVITVDGGQTLTINSDLIIMDTLKVNASKTIIKSNVPGQYYDQFEATVYGVFGNAYKKNITRTYTVLYADKDLLLFYVCGQLDSFWSSEVDYHYFISSRDRSFDSLAKLEPLIGILSNIPEDLNNISFVKNDPKCNN